jgi:hypothetical protein
MFEAERASARGIQIAPANSGAATNRARALTPAETAWIALIPCAIVMLAAIAVLGPPLGHVLVRPGSDALWPTDWWESAGSPEPVKHGRYALALLAPIVLSSVILAGSRRPFRLRPRTIRALVLAGQAAVLALVLVAVLGQRNLILTDRPLPPVFSLRTLVLAAALVTIAVIALRRHQAVAWIGGLARERPATRIACLGIATVYTAVWLIEVVSTDGLAEDTGEMNWIPNGAHAVLDGRTPLVDAHILYAKLLPYPTALVLATFGATTFVFTLVMAVLNLATLLAVYAVFRRIVGSAFALALFLPFVALSDVDHWMRLGSIWPMRYGGAYLLAWLTARHVDGRSPRRAWIVFLVAGLVTIDDVDFGLAVLLASLAALLCARPPRSVRDAWRLAGAAAGGVLGAVAAVTVFMLVRAGEPPRLDVLLEWPRIFTNLGLLALPVPRASLHLAIYATLVAAIAVAAVRLARRADDVLLTSMLAWSGVFGLVAGGYYVARPDDLKLVAMFSAWGFALALLTIVCVRALTARDWRAPAPAELLVLFAFALSICMIGRIYSPGPLIARLVHAPQPAYRSIAEPLVARYTHRGEKVAIMLPESYRISYELGLDNVSPYENENAIVTRRQMRTFIDTIEREGVRSLFTPTPGAHVVGDAEAAPQQLQTIRDAGFEPVASTYGMIAWQKSG